MEIYYLLHCFNNMIEFDSHFVKGSASIADLFKEKDRCGIYILTFETGERYVGKTIDIVKRYAQHRRNHRDIDMIQFHKTSEDKLSALESEAISVLEAQKYRLRNISLMDNPYFVVPNRYRAIDLVMSLEEQEQWLIGKSLTDLKDDRRINSDQRKKYEERMKKLEGKQFFPLFTQILKSYFEIGIPFPDRTEFSSYSVSCLPKTEVYSRININVQEVFTSFEDGGLLWISLHTAKIPLEKELSLLEKKYKGLEVYDRKYKPGGNDQINLVIPHTSNVSNFLREPTVSMAIRTMNLRLMRREQIFIAPHIVLSWLILYSSIHTPTPQYKPRAQASDNASSAHWRSRV